MPWKKSIGKRRKPHLLVRDQWDYLILYKYTSSLLSIPYQWLILVGLIHGLIVDRSHKLIKMTCNTPFGFYISSCSVWHIRFCVSQLCPALRVLQYYTLLPTKFHVWRGPNCNASLHFHILELCLYTSHAPSRPNAKRRRRHRYLFRRGKKH